MPRQTEQREQVRVLEAPAKLQVLMLAMPTEREASVFAAPTEQQASRRQPGTEQHYGQALTASQEALALQRGQTGRTNQLARASEQRVRVLRAEWEQVHIEERHHRLMPPERLQQEKSRSPTSTNVAPTLQPAPPRLRALGPIQDEPYE